jgi:hypothetical protein
MDPISGNTATAETLVQQVSPRRPFRYAWVAIGLFVLCAGIRIGIIRQQGLWADEIFSLSMATGHSLEHPASVADARQGDYVETADPRPASWYRHYAEHDAQPASLRRVLRAAFLSDTSPPLYDVLLYFFTRVAGTSDVALKAFSIFFALASFPLLWSLAREVGGLKAAPWVCGIYTLTPFSVWYGTEGRMYTLMWFLVCVQMLLTVKVQRATRGRVLILAGWALTAAAGLMTHYFFGFVFLACSMWLLLYTDRAVRLRVLAAMAVCGGLILPWYLHVPESLGLWRITGDWLKFRPGGGPLGGPAGLAWSLLSSTGYWGGRKAIELVLLATVVVLLLVLFRAGRLRWKSVFAVPKQLPWFCLAAAALGPVAFDLARHTHTSWVPRYAAAGLPAAVLLLGIAIAKVPGRSRLVLAGLMLLCWLTGVRRCIQNPARSSEYFRELATVVDGETDPKRDVILVNSIPSGVVGLARYMKTTTPIVSWVPNLRPEQLPPPAAGLVGPGGRLVLVRIHNLNIPTGLDEWLRQNAVEQRERFLRIEGGSITFFRLSPRGGLR